MQYTLLEMVQSILASLESDEVSTITETAESRSLVNIIKTTYFDIISTLDIPQHYDFFTLTETDANTPTKFSIPANILKIAWLKYDVQASDGTSPEYRTIPYLDLDTFFKQMYALNDDDTDVANWTQSVNGATVKFMVLNNLPPTYYTTFNDGSIYMNAYDSDVETFLQASKLIAYGMVEPTFTESDSFVPDLPDKSFTLLLNESKALAFNELKQMTNPKAEQRARRGWIHSQKVDRKTEESRQAFDRLPNYGRKR